jgi:hypothetical protein
MSDYSLQVTWSTKDALAGGEQLKAISATELGNEFSAISTAIATKYDSDDIASTAEAQALTLDTVLITPSGLNDVLTENAAVLGDLQALTVAGFGAADAILGWDDSAGAAIGFTLGTGLTSTVGGALQTDDSAINHDSLSGFVANEHIDHSGVTITAGTGLTGGGTIAATRTLNVGAGNGITVNANDVALASSTGGAGLAFSAGVLSVGAGDGITVNANDIDVDSTVVRTTGTGDVTLAGFLSVANDFVTAGVIDNTNTGTLNNVSTTNAAVIRFTGGALTTVTGFAGGTDGRRLVVINQTSAALQLTAESASSTAANRLRFAGSANISVDDSFEFIYDGTDNRWQLVGF